MNKTVEDVIYSFLFSKRQIFALIDVNNNYLGYYGEDSLIDFYHIRIKRVDTYQGELAILLAEEIYEI